MLYNKDRYTNEGRLKGGEDDFAHCPEIYICVRIIIGILITNLPLLQEGSEVGARP